MEGCRNGQEQGSLCAHALEHFAGFVDRSLAARDHGLRRVVEVRGLDHFGAACGECRLSLFAALNHFVRGQTQNRGHGAHAHGHGLLHGGSTQAHERRSLRQCEHTRGHQGAVLSQGVTGHHGRLGPAFSQPSTVSGHRRHQHHRLGVGGHGQRLFGAFMDQLRHVFAQGFGGFFQGFEHHGVVTPGIQHADRLRTLAGKNKSKCRHVQILYLGRVREHGL